METINLETARDEAFLREVEAESGQKVTACYQCGNCTAGCPCGPEYDLQVSQVMRAVQLGNKEMVQPFTVAVRLVLDLHVALPQRHRRG